MRSTLPLFLALCLCACSSKSNHDLALMTAFERSNQRLTGETLILIQKLERAKVMDEKRWGDLYDKSMTVKKLSKDLLEFIGTQQWQLINGKEIQKDFPNILEDNLNKFVTAMLSLAPEKEISELKQHYSMPIPIETNIPMLSAYKNYVLSLENDVLDLFVMQGEGGGGGNFRFDNLEAVVIPHSTSVKAGSKYEATIYLAAFSSMGEQQVVIGNYDPASGEVKPVSDGSTITMSGGKANYSVTATGTGHKNLDGGLRMKMPDGTFRVFPFHSEYEVVK